jgi:hypothetical protein
MREQTRIGEAIARAKRAHPAAQIGAGAGIALAITQGIPQAVDYFRERDARLDNQVNSHIATLGAALERSERERQECLAMLLERED